MMRRSALVLSVLILVTAMATGGVLAGDEDAPRTDTNDAAAVMAAMAQFYTALNGLFKGEAGHMDLIWSHDEDITYMGPGGGFIFGWEDLSAYWKTQSAATLGGEIRSEQEKAVLGGNLAVVFTHEVGHHMDANGQREEISIRATNVFRKEDGQWKMIGHHTDRLASAGE
jgi:ketosteroid isomerase-like protein